MKSWSDMTSTLSSKGYVYGGSRNSNDYIMAAWTRNCTDSEFEYNNKFHWDFDINVNYSVLITKEYSNQYRTHEYYFSSKKTYDSFLISAKQNGFSYMRDSINNNNILAIYAKHNEKLKRIEILFFSNREGGDYYIEYYPPYYYEDVVKNSSSSIKEDTPSYTIDNNENIISENKYSSINHSNISSPNIGGLEGYSLEYSPSSHCPGPGTVIIRVTVSTEGTVTNATVIGGSLRNNSKASSECLTLARQSRFRVPKGQTNEKTGTLTYTIK